MQTPAPIRLNRLDTARPGLEHSLVRGLNGASPLPALHDQGHSSPAPELRRSSGPSGLVVGALLAATVLVLHVPTWGDWITLSPDSFSYLTAARSLARTGLLPLEQFHRPPGFSFVLAPCLWFGDTPWLAIRVAASLASVAAAILTYVLFKRRLGHGGAVLTGLAIATSGLLLRQSATLLSEFAYLPLSLLALAWISRLHDALQASDPAWKWAALAGSATAACLLVRSIGVGLLLAGLAMCLLQLAKSPRRVIPAILLFTSPTILAIGAWEIRQSAYPPTRQYSDIWSNPRSNEGTTATGLSLQIERLARYGPARLDAIKSLVIPEHVGWRLFQSPWNRPTSFAVGGLLIAWCATRLLKRPAAEDVYFLITLGIISVWPYQEGMRLAAPLLPMAWCYVVEFVAHARQSLHRAGRGRVAWGPVMAAIAIAATAAVLERAHLQESLTSDAAKSADRLEAGQNLANWLDARVLAGADLTCLTDQQSDAKLTAIAANYLGRRAIRQFRDVEPGKAEAAFQGLGRAAPLLVENALLQQQTLPLRNAPRPSPTAFAAQFPGVFTLVSSNQIEHWPAAQR